MKCRCGQEVQKIQTILTEVCTPEGPLYDLPEGEQFVVMTGYAEKALPCGHGLGEGYGDVQFFPNMDLANEYYNKMKEKLGKVTEEG